MVSQLFLADGLANKPFLTLDFGVGVRLITLKGRLVPFGVTVDISFSLSSLIDITFVFKSIVFGYGLACYSTHYTQNRSNRGFL